MRVRKEILDEAAELICNGREDDYGEPQESFESIAAYWSLYLGHEVTAPDVAYMMTLLKLSRNKTGGYKRDSCVDGAGYFALAAELEEAASAARRAIKGDEIVERTNRTDAKDAGEAD